MGAIIATLHPSAWPRQLRHIRSALVLATAILALPAQADETVPADLLPLIAPGTRLLAQAQADLNGDGRPDYVFILEKQKAKDDDPDIETGQRPLFVALRGTDGRLTVVKRNDKVVLCSTCGGVFGDPFASLDVDGKTFTVSHYGGSNWRWSNSYKFGYSRRDQSWQLTQVEESSYHTSDPEKAKTATYKPPRHFGKIDLADFDPEHFKGVGPK